MRIVFAAGGTGGHIYPALAIAGELRKLKPETEFMFIAGKKGMERAIIEKAGYPLTTLPVTGMPRTLSPRLVPFAWNLAVSIVGAKKILSVKISPEAADPDDIEMLEDLVMAAVNEALTKAEEMMQQKMSGITGGMNLGGMF